MKRCRSQVDIGEIGLVLLFLGFRRVERRLIGPRIDLGQEVALFDVLAFGERDLVDLAIDAGPNEDRIEGLNGSKAGQVDRKVCLLDGRNAHPNRVAGGGFLRPVCRRFVVVVMKPLPAVIANPSDHQGQQNPTRYPRFFHVGLQT